ncbi:transcription factor cp2 [Holotrichia oblita]|uniref:Transcription factor cp2 n=2 Tax=Holotrichia oblita TaxID=644536 RepID=A0ACB9TP53_HOLOL|nr:transcription factor cp2 [Holotrichia oblita]KAI4468713.1 transcription factor cp2 [Holotrichia oblita]
MFLLIHTMTITECDFVLQAQFFHALGYNLTRLENATLIGRRLSLRFHPNLQRNRHKGGLHRLNAPNLKTLMKRNSGHIRHHLKTIHMYGGPQNNTHPLQTQPVPKVETSILPTPTPVVNTTPTESRPVQEAVKIPETLSAASDPKQTVCWLVNNRFEKYLTTFSSFSGADMLRMSKEDFTQICGQADGIRLYNAIHLKAIAPKLTIYVCRDSKNVYHAIFLSAHSNMELLQKLSAAIGIPKEQVRDIYMQGPHSIHIHLNNDVISHIKEETMFNLEILQDNGSYVLLLKPTSK